MVRHLPMILKNSLRNKRRSLLTLLSIAASLCLLGVLGALYHAFFLTEATEDQALRLIVRNRISLANPLPMSYQQRIRSIAGVKDVTIWQWFGGVYKDATNPAYQFARVALEAEKVATIYPEYKLSDNERKAFVSEQTACIVGRKTADRLGMKLGDRLTVVGDYFPVTLEFVIRGIYESTKDNENLMFHYKYLDEMLKKSGNAFNMVGAYVIRMDRAEDANAISKAVDDTFHNAPERTKTESEAAFVLSFVSFLGNVKAFLLIVCGAVTFTILLVAGNTMAMSVRERTREVGILKTLGFTQAGIIGILVGESIVISIAGGLLGVGFAYAICAAAQNMPSTFTDMSAVALPPIMAVGCVLVAGLIGLISCLIPAIGASRRSIVEALRFAG
jgi:putative ABC transport system permease protein